MATDLAPFAGTVGGGFAIGFVTGYAIKKVVKLAAVIIGLFIAALACLEYQRVLNVDWHKVQAVSQNWTDWVADVLTFQMLLVLVIPQCYHILEFHLSLVFQLA